MGRSRSDSTPLRDSSVACETAAFAEGNTNLSKRWRSWSFPQSQYGIPLGTLTAQEAAKSFWNTDMLKQRLEKIVECAALETSSLDDDDNELEQCSNTDSEAEQTTSSNKDSMARSSKLEDDSESTNDDDLLAVESAPELIPSSEHATAEDWEELEQSAIRLKIDDSSRSDDGLLIIRSAPTLTQRQVEPFPAAAAVLSHSTHIF